jgi:hypothetical protein
MMPSHSVSCAKQAQDFPAIVANPDACSDFTKLCCFFVYVDLQIWQLGKSYRGPKTSWSRSDDCYAK